MTTNNDFSTSIVMEMFQDKNMMKILRNVYNSKHWVYILFVFHFLVPFPLPHSFNELDGAQRKVGKKDKDQHNHSYWPHNKKSDVHLEITALSSINLPSAKEMVTSIPVPDFLALEV